MWLVALVWSGLALADEAVAADAPGWRVERPVSIGARGGVWGSDYTAGGVGGHLKIRPHRYLGWEGYADNFLRLSNDLALHDHVLGFSFFSPLVGNARWFVGPSAGLCVDFRFADPLGTEAPTASDVLFGAHGGAMAEVYLVRSLSLELAGTVTRYVGNDVQVDGWTARAGNGLSGSTAGQVMAAVNVTL